MRKKLRLLFSEILLILEMRKGIMNVTGNNWKKIIIPVFYKIPGFFHDRIELFIIYSLTFFFCKEEMNPHFIAILMNKWFVSHSISLPLILLLTLN